MKYQNFGLPTEGQTWWCGGCAKGHVGGMNVGSKKCEDCGIRQPSFGLPSEEKVRWCSGFVKAHAGPEDLTKKKCEGC
jgi:hypothetical protein